MKTRTLATIAVVLLIIIAGYGLLYAVRSQVPATVVSSTAAASPAASPSNSPSPSASPALSPGTFENRILGYRITLPVAYRLLSSSINAGQPEQLGSDAFTVRTVAEERADCLSNESPSIGSFLKHEFVNVEVQRNVRGLSAAQWASSSPRSRLHTIEAVTVGGYEAARLVQQGIANGYVISANDRMYVLSHLNAPSSQRLGDIAASFRALPPPPFPTAPPAQVARDAASNLGQRLAQAFAAKDANAVAGLMTDCRIIASENIGGAPIGTEGVSRASTAFITALRDRFAQGDLTVTVNPEVQVQAVTGQFFVRSEWKEPDRTTPIDLSLPARARRPVAMDERHPLLPELGGQRLYPLPQPVDRVVVLKAPTIAGDLERPSTYTRSASRCETHHESARHPVMSSVFKTADGALRVPWWVRLPCTLATLRAPEVAGRHTDRTR